MRPAISAETTPATGLSSIQVPEGFSVELAAGPDVVNYPMLAAFDEKGRLFVTESSGLDVSGGEMAEDPRCRIRMLEDTNEDGVFDKATVFADHLSLPMGALWYHGSLYAASPPDFFRFDDPDGDGVSDHRETILSGWNVLNTASLHGPFLAPDGWLYLTHGRHGYMIQTKEGPVVEGEAARLWRCRPDGTQLERFCGGGFDNPIELIFTEAGEIIGTMTYFTDPKNGQRDALDHWIEGGVYPKPHEVLGEFIRTGDLLPPITKFARIAPSGLMRYRGESFGPEYRGDLFSAHFNPHRIQRHILHREGASFRTEDSDFLTSTDPDFHPTDVFEDTDGSILVLDTGGWYVHACPLSRISKPEIRGAIYRIRKKGVPKIEDPCGKRLGISKMEPKDLVKLLGDPRPVVQDQAMELIVEKGEVAITPLRELLKNSPVPETRCQAVWALTRIGTANATKAVREALGDSDPLVLIAAASSLGKAKDAISAEKLRTLAGHENLAVRRQADEALGQIDGQDSVYALLRSVEGIDDPFLEHAATFALIRLAQADQVRGGLAEADPTIRKCALIALDQMTDGALRREEAAPLLGDANPKVRKAALFVLSRHPEWGDEVLGFLEAKLTAPALEPEEAGAVREVLLAFCENENLQSKIAEVLGGGSLTAERKIFLLDSMEACSLGKLPGVWIEAADKLLQDPDAELRWRALALTRSRGITELDATLGTIAHNPSETAAFRVAALSALMTRFPELDTTSADLLFGQLDPKVDPTLRLEAAQALGRSQMDPVRLIHLAKDYLPSADGVILPSLLDAFRNGSDEETGKALVQALLSSEAGLNLLKKDYLTALLASYPESIQTAAAPIFEKMEKEEAEKVAKLNALEPLLGQGDVGRGRQVFFSQKTACNTCHAIGREGGDLGPDLTTIGAIRSGRDLLEAILFPSASFVPDYEPFQVETSDDFYSGVIARQSSDAILLKTGADATVRIPRDEIVEMAPSTVSVMPAGLDSGISQQELLDLLAFLQAQNGREWLLPGR
jgi:putative heme-binding domain-containing protein